MRVERGSDLLDYLWDLINRRMGEGGEFDTHDEGTQMTRHSS